MIKPLLCLLITFQVLSQNDKKEITQLFVKSKSLYEKNNVFQVTTLYKLFPTYKTVDPKEKYEGLFIKKKDEFYTKIGMTETILTKDFEINVDNESKQMSFSKLEKGDLVESSYDLTNFCRNFTSFSLTSTKDLWICSLTAPKVTFVPYSRVVVFLSKKDYRIVKQVLYLLKTVKYKDSKGNVKTDFPRIEIEFSNFSYNIDNVIGKLTASNYFQVRGNEVLTSKRYTGYKIVE